MSASHRRRRTDPPLLPPSIATEARDWAALPHDILLDIFLTLGPREVMLGAEFACTAWRHAALHEPLLWRRIGMEEEGPAHVPFRYRHPSVEMAMRLTAVGRAAGQCEAFKGNCMDDHLATLVQRAPTLKSLHIDHDSEDQSISELIRALKKLPLLQDLQISISYLNYNNENILQLVCQACPCLKTLMLMHAVPLDYECDKENFDDMDSVDGGITMMSELRSLELHDCNLSGRGLQAILDSCPLLESLHVTGYFNEYEMDKELRVKCARVKNMILPSISNDSDDELNYDDLFEEYDDYSLL